MSRKILFSLSLLLLCSGFMMAQVILSSPAFPKINNEVRITFDATQGTGGLAGCNCDIYIHTGVITTASSSASDWKNVVTTWGIANNAWKLTPVPGQADKYYYTIGPSIKDYYGLAANDVVKEMAFVFRNADGTLEGKATGGLDIFYPVYPNDFPFSAILFNPTSNTLIKEFGETIEVNYATSEMATITLRDNGVQLTQVTGLGLDYEIEVIDPGAHTVEIIADNGNTQLTETFFYLADIEIDEAPLPAGTDIGINFINDDEGVILALYAPNKEHVFLLSDINDWTLSEDFQFNKTPDGTTWWIQINDLVRGVNYRYQYLVDGEIRIADPLSTLVLDPSNDPFIPESTYPNMPEYPTDKTTGLVTVIQPGAQEYQWTVNDFERPEQGKLVVYELLLRDFIAKHDYPTLIDSLDYLSALGVNAIELMPVNEFEANISWGYNPSYHNALDKYYGTADDFKRFIDACHERGIAVILDVVYNHAFGQSPMVQLYFDGKPTAENPWFNRDATHPFNVGYDFNHESEATQAYVEKVMRYWLDEFRIDGFRFDLSKGFTQTSNPNNVEAWSQYDASRIAIIKNYANIVWDESPGAYVILEHFAANDEETELIEEGMMVWNNINYNYNEATMGYSNNTLEATSYTSRGWSTPSLIAYMESHDEERMMVKNLAYGNSSDDYKIKNGPTALQRQELASTFFYTIPGAKMLWMFGELGYDVPIDFNGRTGPKPIRWEYLNSVYRQRLYDVTRSLIGLRKDYEVFHTTDFDLNVGSNIFAKSIHLNHEDMNVTVIGNFDVQSSTINPAFQHTGTWYSYFSGDSLEVSDVNALIDLKPGEYYLYTDVKLPEAPTGPIQTTHLAELAGIAFDWTIFPNPMTGESYISYLLPQNASVQVALHDVSGALIRTLAQENQNAGEQLIPIAANLAPGIYFIKLLVEGDVSTRKLVVAKR